LKTPQEIAANVRLIAEYTAELLLIEAKAIERFPHRSLYLKREIDRAEIIIADWIRLMEKFWLTKKKADEKDFAKS
jgi:hypothetical protein